MQGSITGDRVQTRWERDRIKRQLDTVQNAPNTVRKRLHQEVTRDQESAPQTIKYTPDLQPMVSLLISLLLACYTLFYSPEVLLLCWGLLLPTSSFFLSSSLQSTLLLFKRFSLPSQAIHYLPALYYEWWIHASLSHWARIYIYTTLQFPEPPYISKTEHLHHLTYKEPACTTG